MRPLINKYLFKISSVKDCANDFRENMRRSVGLIYLQIIHDL